MDHFYQNTVGENWFGSEFLYSLMVEKANTTAHFVEVGSWKGKSASYMGVEIKNSGKNIKFDCVDLWVVQNDCLQHSNNQLNDDIFPLFMSNIEPVKDIITPIRSVSWEAADRYADDSLDFVFVDAAHDYISVQKDIAAWYPKVKSGGTIAGDDYHNSSDVRTAVHEFFDFINKPVTVAGQTWVVEK